MKRSVLIVLGFMALVLLPGCSTTKSTSCAALENRVQSLENKVQTLESGAPSSGGVTVTESANMALPQTAASGMSAETMTKKQVQEALKNAGYYDGNIDGKIGPKTKAALKEFQKDMGLKVDGVAGRNTKEKLLKYIR